MGRNVTFVFRAASDPMYAMRENRQGRGSLTAGMWGANLRQEKSSFRTTAERTRRAYRWPASFPK